VRFPSNDTIDITKDFIEILQVTDIRYDVTWYGPFLETITSRIGSSCALDAAIAAVTGAVKALRTRQGMPDAIGKYVKGWKALRTSLSDPEQTKSIHTVVAIYLMMICQVSSFRIQEPGFLTHNGNGRVGLEARMIISQTTARSSLKFSTQQSHKPVEENSKTI
jgi:hypothetical protein